MPRPDPVPVSASRSRRSGAVALVVTLAALFWVAAYSPPKPSVDALAAPLPPSRLHRAVLDASTHAPVAPATELETFPSRTRAALTFGPLDGVALGLHSQDPGYDYLPLLKEIHATGTRWVSLLTNHYLEKVDSVEIGIADPRTVDPERLRTTIRQARSLGLHVMLFPILLIQSPGESDWRGTLSPSDRARWFENYRKWIVTLAKLCHEESIEMLSIGSEFNSLQGDLEEWTRILDAVRAEYRGLVTYSANWDSLDGVSFIRQLDAIGMTTYFSLSDENDPPIETMVASWRQIQRDVAEWRHFHGVPLLFTEVGYPSQDGANQNPWNYYTSTVADVAEQRDCYEAFYRVWAGDDALVQGVFFYNWFGVGGPNDTGYTPRGKPALDVLTRWFQGARSRLRYDRPHQEAR